MRPYSDIDIGDIFQPHVGGLDWLVVGKNDEEKLVEISSSYQHPALSPTLWKKASDPIFTRRVFKSLAGKQA